MLLQLSDASSNACRRCSSPSYIGNCTRRARDRGFQPRHGGAIRRIFLPRDGIELLPGIEACSLDTAVPSGGQAFADRLRFSSLCSESTALSRFDCWDWQEPRHSAAAREARQGRAEGDFPLTGVAECQCSRNGGFSGPSWRHSPSDLFVLCRIGDEAVAIAGGGLR